MIAAWVERHRWLLVGAGAALIALAFTGDWLVGRDSALYRGVARSIASGDGYTFRGAREELVHPGYPLVLALVRSPAAALALNGVVALVTLLLIHRLLARGQPPWVATATTALVGINPAFLRSVCELRPDLMLLCATCVVWLGVERLRAGDRGGWLLVPSGLVAAWLLHPTFWFLALALVVWAAIDADRQVAIRAAIVAVVVGVLAIAFDPRTDGFAPFAGGHERLILGKLAEPATLRLPAHLAELVGDTIPRAVLGFGGPWLLGTLASCAVIASVPRLRIQRWILHVAIVLGGCVVLGANPRYLLPVLPFLLAGILRFAADLSTWRPVLPLVIAALAVPAAVGSVRIVLAQRGVLAPLDARYAPHAELARLLEQQVSSDDVVLATEPRILSFLADRRVVGPGELADHLGEVPRVAALRAGGFTHVVLPVGTTTDRDLRELPDLVRAAGWEVTPLASTSRLLIGRLE